MNMNILTHEAEMKYEKELIELNKTNSKSLDTLNAFAKDLESFHTINTEYLKQHIVDDDKVAQSFEEATSLIKKAEIETQNLKDIVFDGKLFKFEKNIEKLDKSILGITKLESMKSLLNTDQMAKLLSTQYESKPNQMRKTNHTNQLYVTSFPALDSI